MSKMSDRIANLTPEQRALLEKRMRAAAPRSPGGMPIAILGMGCRLPGGVSDPEGYWRLLVEGVDAVSEVPADRWDNARLHDPDPDSAGHISSRWGGFVRDVDRFDAAYFGISPREAVRMDPQQRMLLEVAVDALEDAGIATDRLAGSETGVFVGAHGHASDYLWLQYTDPASMDAFAGTGTAHNLFAGRLSYVFDLHGPAVVVDTACSSSLAAVHLAVQSLRSGESSLALAGGVNLILGPHFSIAASRMHMLAPDGRCKAFDQRADGFVRSEGCGLVVLKRLADAITDGDPIRAVIRGSAMNQDGHTNGITAPSGLAQRAVIERALRDAGVDGRAVGYVETHGTGTSLGDPIEVEALAATVGRADAGAGSCFLGSTKTNIGHLEGAAGVAGLMKAVLVLQHRSIPRNLHFTGLNPHISLGGTRLAIPHEPQEWPTNGTARVAGVSSFGWSGTNTHLVVEEAPQRAPADVDEDRACVLAVSARSQAALLALVERYRQLLPQLGAGQLRAMCATSALRRAAHEHRVAVVGRDGTALAARLAEVAAAPVPRAQPAAPRVAFVFPGQGSQWIGMGRQLLATEPVFGAAIERCDMAIQAEAQWSLGAVLAGDRSFDDIGVLQPTLFAMQVALAALWQSWGIVPEAVVGHSMGEVAAAHVAGALSLEDAVRIICRRSGLLRRIAGHGAMTLVELPREEAQAACAAVADRVSVAVSNGPRSTVLSGEVDALASIAAELTARGVYCRPVKVDVASHSPQVEVLREDLLRELASVRPLAAQVPLYSTVDGRRIEGSGLDARYWLRNLREPVRFHDAVGLLLADGFDAFVEISPHPVLMPAVDDAIAEHGADAVTIASTRRDGDERHDMLEGLARLFARGAAPQWRALWPGSPSPTPLPAYPWQRERFWVELSDAVPDTSWRARGGIATGDDDPRRWLFTPTWVPSARPAPAIAAAPGAWLLFADRGGVAPALAAELEKRGQAVWCVCGGDAFVPLGERSFAVRGGEGADLEAVLRDIEHAGLPLAGIVHLCNLDAPSRLDELDELEAFQVAACNAAANIVRTIAGGEGRRAPRLTFVTAGAQPAGGRAPVPAQAPVWGLGRVIAEEHPECWGASIDLAPQDAPAAAVARLVPELLDPQPEDGIAFTDDGTRCVLRLQPFTAGGAVAFGCSPEASYLVTGGLGGVGLESARWLAGRGARHLLLAGRKGLPPRASWDESHDPATRQQIDAVRALESLGAQVHAISLDVTDEQAVREVLQGGPGSRWPAVRGILHAAAVADDCLIDRLTESSLRKVLSPKLRGSAVLARAIAQHPVDFLVLYSSLGSLLGQPGQASYAAANAFMDALAGQLRMRGVRALAVNWGAWQGLGLAQTGGARRTIEELERRGIRGFTAHEGTRALGWLLEGGAVTAAVAPADWTKFADVASRTRVPSMVFDLARRDVPAASPPQAAVRTALERLDPAQRLSHLVGHLRTQLAEVLRLPEERIEPEAPMGTLGLESLTALEFRKRLESSLGTRLSATIVWNYPTAVAMAKFLLSRLFGAEVQAAAPPAGAAAPAAVAAAVDEMSDEDAIRALVGDAGEVR
ncbi:MAG: type I polyketide synthase [Gammaproteobacteria bacterium]|nr:type I polyketide synthase [Gammaproteobacteria bacterium]